MAALHRFSTRLANNLLRSVATLATRVALVLLIPCCGAAVDAQQPRRDAATQPAAYEQGAKSVGGDDGETAQSIRFQQRPTDVGDRVRQTLDVQMELATRIVQSGQTAHESTELMVRQQTRDVLVSRVDQGRVREAVVSFSVARTRQAGSGKDDPSKPQPVEGKKYVVERDGEKLRVTDMQGNIPPAEEFEIVVDSLSSLGKPNPLAKFLLGRTIAVGERLLVPQEIASQLLGLTPEMGDVRRFELTLLRVATTSDPRGRRVGEFLAKIETVARTASQLTTTIAGRVAVETDTCRTVAASLAGPVNMSAIERTPLGIYQYNAHGGIRVAVKSAYSDSTTR